MSTPVKSIPAAVSRERTPPLRFITAASLFDGHDAAINIMRRLLLAQGAEVIHLGHNRSVGDIVRAALQEDADGIACSSYQGGHLEFFRYMVSMLREHDAEHIRVVVGGGGTIAPGEIETLEGQGVERIYSPDDGLRLGLVGMIEDVMRRVQAWPRPDFAPAGADSTDDYAIARTVTLLEEAAEDERQLASLRAAWQTADRRAPVLGITGTGGSGKSSLTDELLNRFLRHFPDRRIAVVAVDPTRRRTGGALLGDRIRMNSLASDRIFMRSVATRRRHMSTSAVLADTIGFLNYAGFDLIVVETAGIGQSDTEIVDLVDLSLYVMTSDYGAASQLEKIDMLDYADLVALNKFEKRGAEDALRDIRKQWKRNHLAFSAVDADVPVFSTIASRFNDPGVNHLFASLCERLGGLERSAGTASWPVQDPGPTTTRERESLVPEARGRYLAEIAESARAERGAIEQAAAAASRAHGCHHALLALEDPEAPEPLQPPSSSACEDPAIARVRERYGAALEEIGAEGLALLRAYPERVARVRSEEYAYSVRGREIRGRNYVETLSHLSMPKIAVPRYSDWGDLLRFLMEENLPGGYPYTAGVYPYRREQEDPTRMFAGEGTPERTNLRFHLLAAGQPTTRLSTAFDSVTLYGEDPDTRPDIYGKVGNSGVSIASLDDMKKLYSGFDLCAPTTSVSMTINGPAPILLAMFLNTAIDQRVERHLRETDAFDESQRRIAAMYGERPRPRYHGALPAGHDGFGLGLLGASGQDLVEPEVYEKLRAEALTQVRGTVQADILKEDQAQNTCIFSTEFAMRMMGDVQAWFIEEGIRNFYSVSISGYHIAEAGANPISQLAFTLANGFTIVEYYLSRGMPIDDFAPNLSFFFSNGMDPEYAVIGRVARRIWARAMRERYGAGARSQMLKYHIQTSGRSLHAQEIQFNDIRTTLQALYALFDACNSLHTNAYDEAITTPTEESVRRAMAIQLIIGRELGLNANQNPWQGSFVVEELTRLVEDAVYAEFERLSERGGVLGAMESMYQRGKIQDESLYYESRKHDGSLPIVGVNTFRGAAVEAGEMAEADLIRSSEEEKTQQVREARNFRERTPPVAADALAELQQAARDGHNVFASLMNAVRSCSLGRITHALYDVGGRYRRNM